jgi:hypothetical protein
MTTDETFQYLIAGLIAFAENDWRYPYPPTLTRARGLLYGSAIQKGNWKFESMSSFISLVQTPLQDWWPFDTCPEGIDPQAPIIDENLQIPPYIEELLLDLDELSESQKFNSTELKLVLDNRKIRTIVQKVRDNSEFEDAYISFRKYLIENPWIDAGRDGVNMPRDAMLLMGQVTDFYEMPSINMLHEGKHWLCPRCNGILIWKDQVPLCATEGLCDRLINFKDAIPIVGDLRTLKMSFRKRVQLPGLPEIMLFNKLSEIPSLTVKLWPEADRYDIYVEKNGTFRFALDVKDYASEFSLASQFRRRSPPYEKGVDFYYVIPNHREKISRGYVNRLRKLSPPGTRIKLASEILQMIERA